MPVDEEAEHRHHPQLHHVLSSQVGVPRAGRGWRRRGSPAAGVAELTLGVHDMEQHISSG